MVNIIPILIAGFFLLIFGIIATLMWNAIKNSNNLQPSNLHSNRFDSDDGGTGIGITVAMHAAHAWSTNDSGSSSSFDSGSSSSGDSSSSDSSSGDSSGSW